MPHSLPKSLACFALYLGASSCRGREMASAAQCERILNQYVDLELSDDPLAKTMSSEDRAALRGRLAVLARADPLVHRVETRCEAEITEGAFRCAVAARTSASWRVCVR